MAEKKASRKKKMNKMLDTGYSLKHNAHYELTKPSRAQAGCSGLG
jgi:hypothetical protein